MATLSGTVRSIAAQKYADIETKKIAGVLGVADGDLSGGLAAWDGYAEFFGTLVRWIAASEGNMFQEVIDDMTKKLKELGPSPLRGQLVA